MDSILTSVKVSLGPEANDDHFDPTIIMHINSALAILTQIGVGPAEGFTISNSDATWGDFVGADKRLSFVRTYVYLKVKLMFDPPLSSAVTDIMKQEISELESRLSMQVDPGETV